MIGTVVTHYEIIEKLGEGGMGVVYKAKDTKLKRTVALKFLPPELTRDPEAKERFTHEAQATSRLDHYNICTIYEIDKTEDGQMFIAMAYYEGETLKEKIERGPLKLEEAIDFSEQVAAGLNEAHKKGIVHRDIKPANIMITDKGQVKIMDFGLAKLRGRNKLTKEYTTLGTVSYMSAEQSRGEEVDSRTDIWSLGVVLYEMITGQLPFKGEYEQAVVYSIMNVDPDPMTGLRTGVPMELERIANKCLEKNPKDRYQHTDEVIVDLRSLRMESKQNAISYKKVNKVKILQKRTVRFAFMGILFLIFIIAIGKYLIFNGKKVIETATEIIAETEWKNSIAVLPFSDLSQQKDQEYFCDGMTEEIIAKLSGIEELKTISRTSVMQYKEIEKDIKEIGKELGVATILEGSIRKENQQLRIVAKLINVMDGFHLWVKTYDRKLDRTFELQDEVAQSIARALRLKLTPRELDVIKTEPSENTEAYEYFLKGKYFINNYLITRSEDDFHRAVKMTEKALEIDSNYALAYAGLAWIYQNHSHLIDDESDLLQGLQYCEKAYLLNPNLAETIAAKGWVFFQKGELERAFEYLKKARSIKPNNSEINHTIGLSYYQIGLYPQAIKFCKKAHELDPFYKFSLSILSSCYMNIGEYDKAILYYQKRMALDPNSVLYLGKLADNYMRMKNYRKAEEALSQAENLNLDDSGLYFKALFYASKRESEKAFAILREPDANIYSLLHKNEKAIKHINKNIKSPKYHYLDLINNPHFDNLRNDPRFKEIVEKQKNIYEIRVEKYGG